MTVHMFNIVVGPDTSQLTFSDAETHVNNWLDSHNQWADDLESHTLREIQDDTRGTYWTCSARFTFDDTKSELLQYIEDKLQGNCLWYRIGYHNCNHDGSGTPACSWDDSVEWTDSGETVPNWVNDF